MNMFIRRWLFKNRCWAHPPVTQCCDRIDKCRDHALHFCIRRYGHRGDHGCWCGRGDPTK